MTNSSTSLQSKLSLNVYVTPMRPMVGTPPQDPGDEPMWSPMSSAFIYGEHDAILVDTLATFDQVDALAVSGLPLVNFSDGCYTLVTCSANDAFVVFQVGCSSS